MKTNTIIHYSLAGILGILLAAGGMSCGDNGGNNVNPTPDTKTPTSISYSHDAAFIIINKADSSIQFRNFEQKETIVATFTASQTNKNNPVHLSSDLLDPTNIKSINISQSAHVINLVDYYKSSKIDAGSNATVAHTADQMTLVKDITFTAGYTILAKGFMNTQDVTDFLLSIKNGKMQFKIADSSENQMDILVGSDKTATSFKLEVVPDK